MNRALFFVSIWLAFELGWLVHRDFIAPPTCEKAFYDRVPQ